MIWTCVGQDPWSEHDALFVGAKTRVLTFSVYGVSGTKCTAKRKFQWLEENELHCVRTSHFCCDRPNFPQPLFICTYYTLCTGGLWRQIDFCFLTWKLSAMVRRTIQSTRSAHPTAWTQTSGTLCTSPPPRKCVRSSCCVCFVSLVPITAS